jgi:hypothetical protein
MTDLVRDGAESYPVELSRVGHGDGSGGGEAIGSPRGFAPGAQSSIGMRLRRYYADLVAEPVPDRFLELLERLVQAPEHRA